MKNLGGRPKAFETIEQLNFIIEQYIASRLATEKPFTMLSFYIYADISKETGSQYIGGTYDDDNKKFSDSLKKLKDICEAYAEEQLFTNKNTAGIIFNLKNNFGWKDKTEVEHQVTNIDVKISNLLDENKTNLLEEST